ncbi:MAG TPA: N-acetylglucosamine-6-phosphate deacetylase [Opitutaceae bacterium]|nr:N-acetylglucosamine-6-phosphate deacetylase [Opitutaceae bacterium]
MGSQTPRTVSEDEPKGFFDMQVNGFAGVDFQQDLLAKGELAHAVKALAAHGTSQILLTLITDTVESLCAKLQRIERMRKDPSISGMVVGYHLEGPYLLAKKGYSGAHDARLMKPPSIPEFERLWNASGGNIRLVTIAPELKGSPEFILHAVGRGARVSIGHSNAGEKAIDEAVAAGLSLCTHLGNGVPQTLHRHDNVIHRLLCRDELYAAFIPDGIHLPPFVLRNLVRAKPRSKVFFTTDCMAAAGAPPGQYRLGKLLTRVGPDGIVRQPGETRYFAGSSLVMDVAARNVQAMLGWTRPQADAACGRAVAKFFGF